MALASHLLVACLLLFSTGCAAVKSQLREALDDVVGLDPDEQRSIVKNARKIGLSPQRHGATGLYAAGGANPSQSSAGGEVGLAFNDYWIDTKLGLCLYGSGAADKGFIGPTAAVRLQLPLRLTPFAGVGVFAGYSEQQVPASTDGVDNDENGVIDEFGETKTDVDALFATIFPELGVHYWLTEHVRLTASAGYNVTTEGRSHDFWMVGGGIALFSPLRR